MPDFVAVADTEAVDGGVVLCANHRLARHLRQCHDRRQAAAGLACWRPLVALTLSPWLAGVVAEALLAGQVPAAGAPRRLLSPLEERLLSRPAGSCAGGPLSGATVRRPAGWSRPVPWPGRSTASPRAPGACRRG